MCLSDGALCPEDNYLPAGGGEETIDNSKQRITNPARMFAITIPKLTLSA